jgi:hypothetical protein
MVSLYSHSFPCVYMSFETCNMKRRTNLPFSVALPHPEVPTAEFYKHISAQLTEPTRMRCLLGWCGSRALPPKPDAPKGSSKEANAEFQALQAGMQECANRTYLIHLADCLKPESYRKSCHKILSQNECLAIGSRGMMSHNNKSPCGRSPILETSPTQRRQ